MRREERLAFSAQLDEQLACLAAEFEVAVPVAQDVFPVVVLDPNDPARWPQESKLRTHLGSRFYGMSVALEELAQRTVRAGSGVENLNSRLRTWPRARIRPPSRRSVSARPSFTCVSGSRLWWAVPTLRFRVGIWARTPWSCSGSL